MSIQVYLERRVSELQVCVCGTRRQSRLQRSGGARHAGPEPNVQGRDDPLADLPGIDTRAGLVNAMGDDKLYRRLLRMFRDRDIPARFSAARAAGDSRAVICAGAAGTRCMEMHPLTLPVGAERWL